MTNELRELLPYLTPREIGEIDRLTRHPRIQSTLDLILSWQYPALYDKSFTILLSGSAGGGKSRLGLEIVHRYMQRWPGAPGLMMRKAREWTEKSIVPFLKQSVIGKTGVAEHKKGDKLFQYTTGSTLYYGGMKDDEQRESVRSIGGDGGLGIALMEEGNAFDEDDYDELIGRMRSPFADYRQIIVMTNPDAPTHWINRRLILGGEASVYYSGAKDNPFNPPEYIDNLNKMRGLLYQRLVLGKWVQAEGVVFDNFDSSLGANVDPEAEYNPEWRVVWGVDDGYVRGKGPGDASYHPRVILFANITPQGAVHVFDEYVACEELSEHSVANALEKPYKRPDIAYVDSSAKELLARLWGSGVTATGATHPVGEGIKNVRRFICDHNNVRLLKVNPRCTHLIRELASYRYDSGSKLAQAGEPKPLKIDDHGPDALRYLMWHLRFQG